MCFSNLCLKIDFGCYSSSFVSCTLAIASYLYYLHTLFFIIYIFGYVTVSNNVDCFHCVALNQLLACCLQRVSNQGWQTTYSFDSPAYEALVLEYWVLISVSLLMQGTLKHALVSSSLIFKPLLWRTLQTK